MALPSTVNTTGLVIVVCGLYVRDVEFKKPNDCGGDEVIEGGGEDVEGFIELVGLLSREVVDGGVEDVPDGGCEVEGGGVEVGSVFVAGGWLGEEGDSEVGVGSDRGEVGTPTSPPVGSTDGVRSEACLGTKMGGFPVGIESEGFDQYTSPA